MEPSTALIALMWLQEWKAGAEIKPGSSACGAKLQRPLGLGLNYGITGNFWVIKKLLHYISSYFWEVVTCFVFTRW